MQFVVTEATYNNIIRDGVARIRRECLRDIVGVSKYLESLLYVDISRIYRITLPHARLYAAIS